MQYLVALILVGLIVAFLVKFLESREDEIKDFYSIRTKPKRVVTKSTNQRYLVIGGNGFLGSHIVEALLARGDTNITIFDNTKSSLFEKEQKIKIIIGDIRNFDQIKQACTNQDVVFHVAALVGYSRLAHEWKTFFDINVTGTRNVLKACIESKVKKLIYTSSVTAMDAPQGLKNADESSPLTNYTHYGSTKSIVEPEVVAANGKNGLLTAVIRPGWVLFGARDPNLLFTLLSMKNIAFFPRGNNSKHDLVYVENIVHGLLLTEEKLKEGSQIAGEVFLLSNGEPEQLRMTFSRWSKKMGINLIFIPNTLVLGISYIVEMIAWLSKGKYPKSRMLKPFNPMSINGLLKEHTYNISKANKLLGYVPLYTNEEGEDITAQIIRNTIKK